MSFLDKIKNAIGIEDADYDDEYYDEEETSNDENVDMDNNKDDFTSETTFNMGERPRMNNVTELSSSSKVRITIQEPLKYDDGPKILDDIINRKIVILNLEMLEVDKKRQIFDFVSGGIYSLNGNVKKVTKDIFVIVPRGVEIESDLEEELKQKTMLNL